MAESSVHSSDEQLVHESINAVLDQLYPEARKAKTSAKLQQLREALEKAKTARDKRIAHPERLTKEVSGPSIDGMDRLLIWAEQFINVVYAHFTDLAVSTSPNQAADSIRTSIARVLEGLSIEQRNSAIAPNQGDRPLTQPVK